MMIELSGGCWQLVADGVERHQGKVMYFCDYIMERMLLLRITSRI